VDHPALLNRRRAEVCAETEGNLAVVGDIKNRQVRLLARLDRTQTVRAPDRGGAIDRRRRDRFAGDIRICVQASESIPAMLNDGKAAGS
jgi:hypothetical protein